MNNRYAARFFFPAWWILLCVPGLAQPAVYPADQDASKHRFIKTLHTPQPIDPEITGVLGAFVKTESLRFKWAIHPALSRLDSLHRLGEDTLRIQENPFMLLAPALRSYRYDPLFSVENISTPFNGYYYRNVFTVKKYDRFICPENPAEHIGADTIWSLRDHFFENDDLYAVYYCPPTGDLRMLGGNAFLQQLPEDAYPFDRAHNYDADAMLMARTRLIHHFGYRSKHINWVYFETDTLRKAAYETGKTRYYSVSETARLFGPGSSRLIIIQIPQFYSIETARPSHSAETGKNILPAEPWDGIELVYYSNRPNSTWKFEPGFPCYEIKWVVRNEPQRYEDVLPQIRGISAAELQKLQADPEWLNYIFLY